VIGIDGERAPSPADPESAALRRAQIEAPTLPARLGVGRVLWIAAASLALIAAAIFALVPGDDNPRQAAPSPTPTLDHALVAIDPETNEVAETVRNDDAIGSGSGLGAGQAGLWVFNGLPGRGWWHVDPLTKSFTPIESGPFCVSAGGDGFAILDQAVWVARQCWIVRINPATHAIVESFPLPGVDADRIAAGGGVLWVMTSSGLARIDPTTNRPVDLPRPLTGDLLAAGEGWVWLADRLDQTITRIDPATAKADDAIDVQSSPDAIAAGAGALWVVDSSVGTVTMIDPATLEVVDTIAVGDDPFDIAVSADTVWVANREDGTVSRIDPDLRRVIEEIPIGGPPGEIVVDPASGLVWVLVTRCFDVCEAPLSTP
jgi:YVTN family beta-propeller protein